LAFDRDRQGNDEKTDAHRTLDDSCPHPHPDVSQQENVMDAQTQLELEAATFRRLRDHLAQRTDVQNIDMMNLTGFCRNCLSRWYQEAANAHGIEMTKEEGRTLYYGMPFEDWKVRHQTDANDQQKADFANSHE